METRNIAMAIAAHPDDIEFMMAGTLLLLQQAGWETHYLNIASGNCGSMIQPSATVRRVRAQEARAACRILGARFHPALVDDLKIFYDLRTIRRLAAVIREVKPAILLVPSPQDYMEDHTNACRLAISAAFVRGMPNVKTLPARRPAGQDVTVYHAMPHGLRDPLRRRILPGAYVNISPVYEQKRQALNAHQSQKRWLDDTQGMDSYLKVLDGFARELGRMSRRYSHAEGWRRHLHYGFCNETADPLRDALGRNFLINQQYEANLEKGI